MIERRPSPPVPETAIAFHDERAGRWAASYRYSAHFTQRARDWEAVMRDYLFDGSRLLDLGCGSGELSVVAARLGTVPTCIDGSAAMMAQARAAVGGLTPGARFYTADASDLPAKDGEFDVAIASSLLEYLDPLPPVLNEVRRVVRTGGLFLCTVPNPHSLYRRLEGMTLKLITRPVYRRFVNPEIYRRNVSDDLVSAGFQLLETRLMGLPPKLPARVGASLVKRHRWLATMTLFVTRAV